MERKREINLKAWVWVREREKERNGDLKGREVGNADGIWAS